MKKRTKILLVCLAALCLAITGLVTAYYIFPLGYSREAPVDYSYYSFQPDRKHLVLQFLDENIGTNRDYVYFTYNGVKYSLFVAPGLLSNKDFYVSRGSEKFGEFLKGKEAPNSLYDNSYQYSFVFFENGYLYYLRWDRISRFKVNGIDNFSTSYYKYLAYSFDLDTGENLAVELTVFFDKFKPIYDSFIGGPYNSQI